MVEREYKMGEIERERVRESNIWERVCERVGDGRERESKSRGWERERERE